MMTIFKMSGIKKKKNAHYIWSSWARMLFSNRSISSSMLVDFLMYESDKKMVVMKIKFHIYFKNKIQTYKGLNIPIQW